MTAKDSGCLPWIVGLLILGIVASFASDEDSEAEDLSAEVVEWQDETFVPDTAVSTEIEVPDRNSIERASLHAGRVVGALGLDGATIYSELCYASLVDLAELTRLDRCYAFDLFAKRLLETSVGYTPALFAPDVIQERWQANGTRIADDEGAMITRRTAVESAASLMNAAIIPPPSPAPEFAEPIVGLENETSTNQDNWDSTFETDDPVEPALLD